MAHLKNLIERSLRLKEGPPVCYRLTTEKQDLDKDSMVRRWTFGHRDTSKKNKSILLMGETGSGKTSLINALVNYFLGVKWEDKVWFEITEETEGAQQTETQTTAITVYEVFVQEVPFSLTIIDTPGHGDTRGVDYDQLMALNLRTLFRSENGIHEIDAVGLVVKASVNRLSDRQCYIFDAVLSLFGKDIENNIVALVTHTDGFPPKNAISAITAAKVPCAKNMKNQPVYFLFNNCQSETCEEEMEDCYKDAWNKSAQHAKRLFDFLEKAQTKSTKMTEGVLRKHEQLKACVNNVCDRIRMTELKQNELKQTETALKKHQEQMKESQNFECEVDEPYKAKEFIKKSATCCTVCEENCHYPGCWWVKDLSWCSAMSGNNCTVCRKKCHYKEHVKGDKIYVLKTRKVKKTSGDLKKKYEMNEKAAGEKATVMSKLQEELKTVKSEEIRLVEEAYQCIVSLEENALKADSLSTLLHLDFLIEKVRETGNMERVQNLERLKKSEEENKGAMHYLKTTLSLGGRLSYFGKK